MNSVYVIFYPPATEWPIAVQVKVDSELLEKIADKLRCQPEDIRAIVVNSDREMSERVRKTIHDYLLDCNL